MKPVAFVIFRKGVLAFFFLRQQRLFGGRCIGQISWKVDGAISQSRGRQESEGEPIMKKLAFMATNRLRSYLLVGLAASIVLILGSLQPVSAADFFCASGNVTCLIASINSANGMPGKHIINLEPGIYTLQTVDNGFIAMGYR